MLRILTKTNGFENEIDDELIERKILLDEDFIEQFRENVNLKNVSIRENKYHLKIQETKRLMQNNQLLNKEEANEKTNAIEPFSNSMRRILADRSKSSPDQMHNNNKK